VASEPVYFGHCHFRACRRASGAGHSTYVDVPRPAMTVRGETQSYAQPGGSGLPAARPFCPVYGSQLFGACEIAADMATFYAGTLDDPSAIRPDAAINVRSRQPWGCVAGDLAEFEDMPPGAGA